MSRFMCSQAKIKSSQVLRDFLFAVAPSKSSTISDFTVRHRLPVLKDKLFHVHHSTLNTLRVYSFCACC